MKAEAIETEDETPTEPQERLFLIETMGRYSERWRPFSVVVEGDVPGALAWARKIRRGHTVRAFPYGEEPPE